ncbi:unnamed protein product [Effrenium voratum]|nr:unnamed protein product [Effrenium voratum]
MGCSNSALARENSYHEQHAPMFVVKVRDALRIQGRLPHHQQLREKGMLVCHDTLDPKSLVVFVSHEWLGRRHPDETGEQLRALQSVLRKLHTREIVVQENGLSQFRDRMTSTLGSEYCDQLLDAYIWYDYFCVPQNCEAVKPQDQVRYIRSIPHYVESCQVFVALVPSLIGEGGPCNYSSWLRRGWCRTEMWCKQLSDASSIPVIVVPNGEVASFVNPQWLRFPVPEGDFAIESDRLHCCHVIQRSLDRKLPQLRLRNVNSFRFFTARFEKLVGLPPRQRSLEQFCLDFAFPGACRKGLSPVACATLAEDTETLRNLVVAKASLDTPAPDMTKLGVLRGFRPLHLAASFSSQNLELIETLLDLRANPNYSPPWSHTPLACCKSAKAIELLVQHRADVNGRCSILEGMKPIHIFCGEGASVATLRKLLELRADPNAGRGSLPPLVMLAVASADGCEVLGQAQALLDHQADINQTCEPKGLHRMLELTCRAFAFCSRGAIPTVVRDLSELSTTALGFCALYDSQELAAFLLEASADVEIRSHRGHRAADLAVSKEMRRLLSAPAPEPRISSPALGALMAEFRSDLVEVAL